MSDKSNDNVPLSYRIFGTQASTWPPDVAEREAVSGDWNRHDEKQKEAHARIYGLKDGPKRHESVKAFEKLVDEGKRREDLREHWSKAASPEPTPDRSRSKGRDE